MTTWIAKCLSVVLLLASGMLSAETITTTRLSCEIENTPKATTLTVRTKGSDGPVKFRIDWLPGNFDPEDFRNHPAGGNSMTSTHRLGKTTVTRTIRVGGAADCIMVHVIADQPGAVSFNASFASKHPSRIANRREIILTGGETHAHAWILPFESDVHDDGKGTVSLHGEGEALIILNLTTDPETVPISDTLKRLGEKYDPDHNPPDPHRIWEGVLGTKGTGE